MNKFFIGFDEAVKFYNTPIIKRRLESSDPVRGAFECSYFDAQRTFRGISKLPERARIKQEIYLIISSFYKDIVQNFSDYTLRDFDGTHLITCDKIISVGSKYGFVFCVGQVQKILNMFFKYILLIDERLNTHLDYFHIPLDGVILNGIIQHETKSPLLPQIAKKCIPWSKINDYGNYMALQEELRKNYNCPIVSEFNML